MIPDKQFHIQLMRRRKDKNLIAIQKYAPHFMHLVEQKGKVPAGIYVGNSGEIDLVIEGQRVYGMDPRKVAQVQVEAFKREREAFYLVPSKITLYDENQLTKDAIDSLYRMKLGQVFGTTPNPDKLKELTSGELKEGQRLGALISVGLGLGYHLELLIDTYDIKYLIVIERDPEIFKASLYTANWEKILSYCASNERSLFLFVGYDDAEELSRQMVYQMGYVFNTPLLYYTPIFLHLFGPFYEKVGKLFTDRINEVSTGWGFFQDELWSLEYTLENIKRELPLFYGTKPVPSDAVAFVVGAGPSLEYALDFIKQNQHKAVIFSCGSAIGTLYQEGIKPDFHVEIERTKQTYDALVISADPDYLRTIPALYNNPMYPQVAELFDDPRIWLKANDTGASLFPPHIPRLNYSNPTVVNGGLSLAVNMGFREIYLFGTDMGYKDPKKHHARGNVALKEGTEFYKEKESQEYELEGNFGGTVYSNWLLVWARSMIQDLLKSAKGVRVYNTSDGAKIEFTKPIRIDQINLRGFKKSETLKLIDRNFSKDYLMDPFITQKAVELLESAKELELFVKGLFSRQIRDTRDMMDTMNSLYVFLYNKAVQGSGLFNMLRGGWMGLEHLCLFLTHQEGKLFQPAMDLLRDYLLSAVRLLEETLEPFLTVWMKPR